MKPTRESLARTYRAALTPQLEAILCAGKVAADHAAMTFDWPAGAVTLSFREDTGNAVIVLHDDLDALDKEADTVRFARLDDDPFRVARVVLDLVPGVLAYPNMRVYEPQLRLIDQARYALIIVTRESTPAFQDGAGRFTAGRVAGAALLIELASGELRGAFELAVESGGEVGSKRGLMDVALREDLERQYRLALARGISRRFPGAELPDGFTL